MGIRAEIWISQRVDLSISVGTLGPFSFPVSQTQVGPRPSRATCWCLLGHSRSLTNNYCLVRNPHIFSDFEILDHSPQQVTPWEVKSICSLTLYFSRRKSIPNPHPLWNSGEQSLLSHYTLVVLLGAEDWPRNLTETGVTCSCTTRLFSEGWQGLWAEYLNSLFLEWSQNSYYLCPLKLKWLESWGGVILASDCPGNPQLHF